MSRPFLALLTIFIAACVAVEFDVTTLPIASVTVYQDRAEIVRTVEFVPEAAGPLSVSFTNISSNLLSDSLKLASSEEAVLVTGISHRQVWQPARPPPPELSELEEKLRVARESLSSLQRSRSLVLKLIEVVEETLRKSTVGTKVCDNDGSCVTNPASLESFAASMTFVTRESERLGQELANATEAVYQQNKLIDNLNKQLEDARRNLAPVNPYPVLTHVASSTLTVWDQRAPGKTVKLALSYVLFGAGWTPHYEARYLTAPEQSLSLTYTGQVWNRCGEDWLNAPLVLSTAAPSSELQPPPMDRVRAYLTTRHIPQAAPSAPNMRGARLNAYKAGMQQMAFGAASAPEPGVVTLGPEDAGAADGMGNEPLPPDSAFQDLAFAEAAGAHSGVAARFIIRVPVSIRSSEASETHRVVIGPVELADLELNYIAVPRRAENAVFTRSRSINRSPYTLFPGPVVVSVDGQLIGSPGDPLRLTPPGAELLLYLGVDRDLVLTTSPRVTFNETQGVVFTSNRVSSHFTATLLNNKAKPVDVTLYAPVPVSEQEDLQVMWVSPPLCQPANGAGTPNKCASLNEHNYARYTVTVPSHARVSEEFRYRLVFPKDRFVQFG